MTDEFAKIKERYIATFDQKKSDLNQAIGASQKEIDLPQLHELLHKLTGSSGGYGLHDLCDLAKQGMLLSDLKNEIKYEKLTFCVEQIIILLNKYQQK